MDENPTVISLTEVRRGTATSTSRTEPDSSVSSSFGGAIPPQYPGGGYTGSNVPSDPSWFTFDKAVWAVIGFIFIWLGFLTSKFYEESKSLSDKISSNQEALINQIHQSQIHLNGQLSAFEERLNSKLESFNKDVAEDIEDLESDIKDIERAPTSPPKNAEIRSR